MSLRYILLLIILNSTLSKIRTKCIETLLRTKTKNKKCQILTYDKSGNKIQYVKACKRGKICYISDNNYGYCGKYSPPLVIGDKAKTDQECLSGNRKGKRCRGLGEGAFCTNTSQCNRGYYCSYADNTCQKNPTYCFSDEQCDIFQVCTFTSKENYHEAKGECVNIGSLKNGNFSVNKFACESGYSDINFICSEIISVDKYCYINSNNMYNCQIKSFDGNKITNNIFLCREDENYLDVNGNVVCLNKGYYNSFQRYLSVLNYRKNKVKKDKSQGFPNVNDRRFHGENKHIKKAYFYVKYYQFSGKEDDDDYNCIVDYFIRQYLHGRFIQFNKVLFLSFAFLLF